MSSYRIMVARADGRLQPVAIKHPWFDMVCRQALRFAQNAAVHGCPLGDALPPKWVDVRDDAGGLLIRVVVDESLKPRPEILS